MAFMDFINGIGDVLSTIFGGPGYGQQKAAGTKYIQEQLSGITDDNAQQVFDNIVNSGYSSYLTAEQQQTINNHIANQTANSARSADTQQVGDQIKAAAEAYGDLGLSPSNVVSFNPNPSGIQAGVDTSNNAALRAEQNIQLTSNVIRMVGMLASTGIYASTSLKMATQKMASQSANSAAKAMTMNYGGLEKTYNSWQNYN